MTEQQAFEDEAEAELMAVQEHWAGFLTDAKMLGGDAGIVGLHQMLYTWALLADITLSGYADRWCYASYEAAKAALDAWDGSGEPGGWKRHPMSGRRRGPDGVEYVMP